MRDGPARRTRRPEQDGYARGTPVNSRPHANGSAAPRVLRAGRLWGLGLLGILPALLLGAFGLLTLRREEDLAVVDARRMASDLAGQIASAATGSLVRFGELDAAAVRAAADSARRPQDELLTQMQLGVPVRFFANTDGWAYPPEPGDRALGRSLEASELSEGNRSDWQEAVHAEREPQRRDEAISRWREILNETPAEAPWRVAARFHLGRTLVQAGKTDEGAVHLESVVRDGAVQTGDTGLPLDVLAARSLLQAAEVDSRLEAGRPAWLHLLAERAVVRRSIPVALAREFERGENPPPVQDWERVAEHHRNVRRALPNLPESCVPVWLSDHGTNHLRWCRQVAGGTWVAVFPEERVRRLGLAPLDTFRLPPGVDVTLSIVGKPFSRRGGEVGGEILATAELPAFGDSATRVALSIADPAAFHALTRLRARMLGALIAFASLVCVFAVVAALRAYERERRLAAQQADFVASVSHELRAPLAAVRLMSEELMDAPGSGSAATSSYPRLILREAQRLGRLVENVLRHARLEQGAAALDRRDVDLREVVQGPVESLRPSAADRGVRLELQMPARPVRARVDLHALQQVVVNLVDNAVKHSPDGAVVQVGLAPCETAVDVADADQHAPLNRTPRRPIAQFWVADRGTGIPRTDHERIFERFYRRGSELRRETCGVGLGLALVKRIVEAHEGSIVVESEPGEGARFIVKLPLEATS